MEQIKIQELIRKSDKILVGLGEEWKVSRELSAAQKERILRAYQALYDLIHDKDYFIITMATDAVIYDTPLGSSREQVTSADERAADLSSCSGIGEALLEKMDQVFPKKEIPADTRRDRIVAPCGNETWRQCSLSCTKDIWEPGEIPDDRCPHCGAPLTGNTIEARTYIEEGYLPWWERYTRWLANTLNHATLILELGVGFDHPGVIRFPFEKTAFFNQKAFLYRVHRRFPQTTEELGERALGIRENSPEWIIKANPTL